MQIAKTDRHMPTFAEAIAACAELAETDDQLNDMAEIVRATARRHPMGVFGRADENDFLIKTCRASIRRLPPIQVVEFVREEMVEGNALSQKFCNWLSVPSVGTFGDLPGLSNEELIALSDSYVGSTSSVLLQAYKLDSKKRLPLLRYFVSYTSHFTRDQLTVRDPLLKETVHEIAPIFKQNPSLDEIAIMLPLLMRYGVDVQDEIIKCESEIFKNTAEYNSNSKLIRVLAQYRLLPWPGDPSTESEYSPSSSEAVDLRLRVLARHIEVVCASKDWTSKLPIDGVLNSIYQNLPFASEKAKNDTAGTLKRVLSNSMFNQYVKTGKAARNNAELNLPRQQREIESLIAICTGNGSAKYNGHSGLSHGINTPFEYAKGNSRGGSGGGIF